MSDERDERLDAVEFAAATLVAQVKQTQKDHLELPIVDQSCVWKVTVKKMGIREGKVPN
jgi:hypothetical protein